MLASEAEPRHYAGLALLKLADNFENHLRIAEEGGIQALLRLGRVRSTDEQLQYKAALTIGQLASNAVKLIPNAEGRVAGSSLPTDGNLASQIKIMSARRKTEYTYKIYLLVKYIYIYFCFITMFYI